MENGGAEREPDESVGGEIDAEPESDDGSVALADAEEDAAVEPDADLRG